VTRNPHTKYHTEYAPQEIIVSGFQNPSLRKSKCFCISLVLGGHTFHCVPRLIALALFRSRDSPFLYLSSRLFQL